MSFGITELVIILLIVILIFGTKKLRTMGSDLGGAIKNFKSAADADEDRPEKDALMSDMESEETQDTLEGEIKPVSKEARKAASER